MNARQAAAFAAVEATGLSKSDIARIAGTHRSQVSRWVNGEQRPSYDRIMALAARLRSGHPGVAEELVMATGYGPRGAVPEPIPPEVLRVIRKNYSPDQQREIIEKLEAIGPPEAGDASADAP